MKTVKHACDTFLDTPCSNSKLKYSAQPLYKARGLVQTIATKINVILMLRIYPFPPPSNVML